VPCPTGPPAFLVVVGIVLGFLETAWWEDEEGKTDDVWTYEEPGSTTDFYSRRRFC